MKQLVISIQADDTASLKVLLNSGWIVKQMVAECVSAKNSGVLNQDLRGKIVFLLEQNEE